jgi:acetyl esterase/lipase
VFWTQGGGFVIEDPTADEAWCRELAAAHDCIVVSVGWRRAPEHPYPAAIDDCYDGISWITDNAVELGIDRRRLIIAGNSSGGGLTASLALMIRDRGEINVIHQMLIYPMLDDRNESASSHMVTDSRLWDREKNAWAWKYYLGERFGAQDPAGHAVPARAEDLSGLCPTSILTGELDLFRDENVQYALRLFEAGVPTELHVYAGAPHGFDRLADSPTVRRFRADRDAIIGAALASTTSSKDATSG